MMSMDTVPVESVWLLVVWAKSQAPRSSAQLLSKRLRAVGQPILGLLVPMTDITKTQPARSAGQSSCHLQALLTLCPVAPVTQTVQDPKELHTYASLMP
jgi:hypothetical protein